MFTGIISAIGSIENAKQSGDLRIQVSCPWDDVRIGESIAVNGACLTVVELGKHIAFDLSAETISRTAPRWNTGDKVNLERALKMGDALDGHMVTGHVDGLATLETITPTGDSFKLTLAAPASLSRYIAEKGSVTLDGVSLTVNETNGNDFSVNIIPHTWQHTTLSLRKPGDTLNLEIDLIARYVERLSRT